MRRAVFVACALALGACDGGPPQQSLDAISVNGAGVTPRSLPAFFDCLRATNGTILSAHRGGPAPGYAENAIPTFARTVTLTAAFIEVDVSRTRDGVLVLMHDDTVERTTDGEGPVSRMTVAEFAALSLQDEAGRILDAHPPTLREALDWANGRTVLELDVKRGVSYEDVAREVEAAGAIGRVVFITYSVDGASRLARVAPEAMIYTTIESQEDLDTLERRGVDLTRIVAWLGDEGFDEDLVEALAARGLESRVGMFSRDDPFESAPGSGIQSLAVNHAAEALRGINRREGNGGYPPIQCAAR